MKASPSTTPINDPSFIKAPLLGLVVLLAVALVPEELGVHLYARGLIRKGIHVSGVWVRQVWVNKRYFCAQASTSKKICASKIFLGFCFVDNVERVKLGFPNTTQKRGGGVFLGALILTPLRDFLACFLGFLMPAGKREGYVRER